MLHLHSFVIRCTIKKVDNGYFWWGGTFSVGKFRPPSPLAEQSYSIRSDRAVESELNWARHPDTSATSTLVPQT